MGGEANRVPESGAGAPASAGAAVEDGHHMARGAAANALVLLASNFRAVFTFLIARLLGQAALGRFGLAFAATELLSKAGMLGFDNSIIPFLAPHVASGDVATSRRLFRQVSVVAGVGSLVVAAIAVPLGTQLGLSGGVDALAHGGSIMLLALPGIAVARIATSTSRSVLAMSNEFYSRGLVETWVTTGVFVVAVALGMRDEAPAVAVVVGTGAAACVAWVLASRALTRRIPGSAQPSASVRDDVDPARFATFWARLRFSLPIAGSSLLTVLVMQADVLLLGTFVNRAPGVTAEAFGVFCIASEIAGGLRKVRQVFDPIFAPIVANRAVFTDRASLRATVSGPGRWVLAVQLPIVAVMVLAGGPILSIYGPGFSSGALWLALLALAHGTNTFAGLVETLLMIERPGLNLVNAGATVAIQVLTGLWLIPRLGVTGAALAMCIGFASQGVLRFVEVRHVFGWHWPWRGLVRPLVAAAVAAVPAAALALVGGAWAEVAAALLFVGLYAGGWLWLGADPADREIWQRLTRRRAS